MNPSRNTNNQVYNSETNNFKISTVTGDFFKMYQDPTTLGFKLFFHNLGANINNATNTTNTNTINSSGLFGDESNTNSALYYLKSMGDVARYTMLKDFIKLLSKINSEYPWYFQTLDGLDDAWKRDYNKPKFKKEITITCLESLDLRITALMDLYRKIAFDWNNRRVILPDNLRKFEVSVKVFDVRNFQRDPYFYLDSNIQKSADNYRFLGENITETTQITFNLTNCEFIPDESASVLSSVSNANSDTRTQTVKFSYENIEEDNLYRILSELSSDSNNYYLVKDYLKSELDTITAPNIQTTTLNKSKSKFKIGNIFSDDINDNSELSVSNEKRKNDLLLSKLENVYQDIKERVSADAANFVKSKINSLYLGNIFGFSTSTSLGTLESNALNKISKNTTDRL